MNSALSPNQPPLTPDDTLYIYYLRGQVKAAAEPVCRTYLGTWQEGNDAFLFFAAPSMPAVKRLLGAQPRLDFVDRYQMTYAEWMGGRFDALQIGPFWITTPWHDTAGAFDKAPKRLRIVLDPGVVFGSGLHPTTADSITAMTAAFHRHPIRTAIDMGTGTGLLALAAARLGCRRVLALDLNRLAAQTARHNVALNRLNARIMVIQAEAADYAGHPADLVMANIHYDVISELLRLDRFYRHRWVVFSGLLRSQLNQLKEALARRSVRWLSHWSQDGVWHTVLARIETPG